MHLRIELVWDVVSCRVAVADEEQLEAHHVCREIEGAWDGVLSLADVTTRLFGGAEYQLATAAMGCRAIASTLSGDVGGSAGKRPAIRGGQGEKKADE